MTAEMSPINRFTESKSAELQQRTHTAVRDMLKRHSGLIGPEIVDLISQREGKKAAEDFISARLGGLANDNSSERPGLVLYVKPEVKDEIVEKRKERGEIIADAQIIEINPNLFSIIFPDIRYTESVGAVLFYKVAGEQDISHMALDFDKIVRIEGYKNELWQNRDYNWNGTTKQIAGN